MAKRPQTEHGKALAAFVKGQITREEYQDCIRGVAWVNGLHYTRLRLWGPGLERRVIRAQARP